MNSTEAKPIVTVFTLVYNTNPEYVLEAVKSIYAQKYENIEHIILNDNPEDNVYWPIIKKYIMSNNLPSIILENNVNMGICNSLNRILEIAKGKYICGCSDDVLLDTRIATDVDVFEGLTEDYAVMCTLSQVIDHEGKKQFSIMPNINFSEVLDGDILNYLFKCNPVCAVSATIRTSALSNIGGYNSQYTFEDYPMWFHLASLGYKFKFVPELNTLYRRHSESFSVTKESSVIFECYRVQLDFAKYDFQFEQIKNNIIKHIYSNDKTLDWMELMKLYLKFKYNVIFRIVTYFNRTRLEKTILRLLHKYYLIILKQ